MTPFVAGLRGQLAAIARGRTSRLVLALFLVLTLLTAGAFRAGALRELPVAVVDLDGTGPSRMVARWLDATPDLRVVHDGPASLEAAQAMLANGELTAVVVLPDVPSAALKRGRPAEVFVALEPGNLLAGVLEFRKAEYVGAVLEVVRAASNPHPVASLPRLLQLPENARRLLRKLRNQAQLLVGDVRRLHRLPELPVDHFGQACQSHRLGQKLVHPGLPGPRFILRPDMRTQPDDALGPRGQSPVGVGAEWVAITDPG